MWGTGKAQKGAAEKTISPHVVSLPPLFLSPLLSLSSLEPLALSFPLLSLFSLTFIPCPSPRPHPLRMCSADSLAVLRNEHLSCDSACLPSRQPGPCPSGNSHPGSQPWVAGEPVGEAQRVKKQQQRSRRPLLLSRETSTQLPGLQPTQPREGKQALARGGTAAFPGPHRAGLEAMAARAEGGYSPQGLGQWVKQTWEGKWSGP